MRTLATWRGTDPERVDAAAVDLGPDRLSARGTSVTADWRLGYRLVTGAGWVTRSLDVRVDGDGWWRELALTRDDGGGWSAWITVGGSNHGLGAAPGAPGGDPAAALTGALDCDLGLCPLTNTMPVLRHGLVAPTAVEPVTLLMAWVSVPELGVHASEQRYSYVDGRYVDFAALDPDGPDFTARIELDADGLVVDYPSIGRRI